MDFDAGGLESVVERLLDATQVTLADWSAEELLAGDGQGLGVFRLTGAARVDDKLEQWSMILKVLPGEGAAPPTAWSLPIREPLAYHSGLLETLPRALRAPRCLRYVRQRGRHHLWLEDLGRDDARWSLSDYAHAARQLGRFNGAYLEQRPVPAREWLSCDWLRSWLAEGAAAIDELPRHRSHPLVRRVYPPALCTELAYLWTRRDTLLAAPRPSTSGPLPQRRIPAQPLPAVTAAARGRLGLPRGRTARLRARSVRERERHLPRHRARALG